MDKERNQIRFEMRGLLVNNEDLLRTNAQLQGETKRMRDRMQELERDNAAMVERFRLMEVLTLFWGGRGVWYTRESDG